MSSKTIAKKTTTSSLTWLDNITTKRSKLDKTIINNTPRIIYKPNKPKLNLKTLCNDNYFNNGINTPIKAYIYGQTISSAQKCKNVILKQIFYHREMLVN